MNRSAFIRTLASFGILLFLGTYFITEAKFILLPITFAILLALTLLPLNNGLRKWIRSDVLSILISFFILALPIFGFFWLAGMQMNEIIKDSSAMNLNPRDLSRRLEEWIQPYYEFESTDLTAWIAENLSTVVQGPVNFLSEYLSASVEIATQVALILILSFLFLLYKRAFGGFILTQISPNKREEGAELIRSMLGVIQGYLSGMVIVIIILSLLNSLGLWALGIPYPFFWGFLAGVLAIIPYVGTLIGGFLPFAYSLFIMEYWWQPIGIIIIYGIVQSLEGNFITPKIVGDRVRINVLFAILSIIIGNAIWGIPGMIVALPILAMLKILLEHISYTRPIAILMSSDILQRGPELKNEFKESKYQFFSLFKDDKKEDS
jgi:predicted PurR-regulated permease PerM